MSVKTIVAQRPGKLSEVLTQREITRSQPLGEGQIDVRMTASTVNPSDAVTVSGAYASRTEFPFVPGFEGVGVIERVGPGVPANAIGERVLPIGSAGNWQEIKRTAHSWCVPVPDDIPDTLACFAYINPLTALLMVQRCCTGDTRHVAVTAATSTIAGHLAELLVEQGIRPVGLTRGVSGRRATRPEKWVDVLSTSQPTWPQRLRQRSSTGDFDVIFDSVGGDQARSLMRLLRPGGVLVHFGLLSGRPIPAECFDRSEGRRVEMFRLRDIVHACPRAQLPALFEPVLGHLRNGLLHTRIAQEVGLGALPTVLRRDKDLGRGKLLITYDR
ncbi:zinc-dependent alcohol dehydrogenase family protein [Brevibacterium sp.]|jgi:NADPH:quinone reductase-like Zn-dependent oxidoreductase|uniref:zinc-dependent alcohol dehydrogenase family protein n=1 Tax=Brevibacterium sp. TaxID=1701 RepID=UPI002636E1B1|nr:zinc-dependent alcohol dehydrogenase family protein [Brevibacterium sp.]